MARLTQHGLRRTIGAQGLFATAYGNVGSSIYYALGLVASYATAKSSGLAAPVLSAIKVLIANGTYRRTLETSGIQAVAIASPRTNGAQR